MSVSSERSNSTIFMNEDDASSTTSPFRIEMKTMDDFRASTTHSGGVSKIEAAIADILSVYECFSDRRVHAHAHAHAHGGGGGRGGGARGGRSDAQSRSSGAGRGAQAQAQAHANEWKSIHDVAAAHSSSSSWNTTKATSTATKTDAKRPRIGNDTDPGMRAIRSLLNKINDSNFDAIQTQVVELVLSGGVAVRVAVNALLEKSSNDGDGFTMAYTRLLAAIAGGSMAGGSMAGGEDASATVRASALKCIGEFLHEIYGSGDVLWNEVKSVSDATVRCKPTEDYDGFCAALKAKKKIYGRHKTSLTILTLMAKDIPGIPKPADAVAKLVGLMKRAVVMVDEENKGDESALSTGLFHCLEVEACCDEGDENDSIKVDDIRTRTSTREVRDVAIEILLELVSQLSVTLSAVKKEAFVAALKALNSGLQETLTREIAASCGTQCRFRAEAVISKLEDEAKLATIALVKKSAVAAAPATISSVAPSSSSSSSRSHGHGYGRQNPNETAHRAATDAMRGAATESRNRAPLRVPNASNASNAQHASRARAEVPRSTRLIEGVSWRSVIEKP